MTIPFFHLKIISSLPVKNKLWNIGWKLIKFSFIEKRNFIYFSFFHPYLIQCCPDHLDLNQLASVQSTEVFLEVFHYLWSGSMCVAFTNSPVGRGSSASIFVIQGFEDHRVVPVRKRSLNSFLLTVFAIVLMPWTACSGPRRALLSHHHHNQKNLRCKIPVSVRSDHI